MYKADVYAFGVMVAMLFGLKMSRTMTSLRELVRRCTSRRPDDRQRMDEAVDWSMRDNFVNANRGVADYGNYANQLLKLIC